MCLSKTLQDSRSLPDACYPTPQRVLTGRCRMQGLRLRLQRELGKVGRALAEWACQGDRAKRRDAARKRYPWCTRSLNFNSWLNPKLRTPPNPKLQSQNTKSLYLEAEHFVRSWGGGDERRTTTLLGKNTRALIAQLGLLGFRVGGLGFL